MVSGKKRRCSNILCCNLLCASQECQISLMSIKPASFPLNEGVLNSIQYQNSSVPEYLARSENLHGGEA